MMALLRTILIILMVVSFSMLNAQTEPQTVQGQVTYVTSQNVYVRFGSTAGMKTGDTLYGVQNDQRVPLLKIASLSSISVVCEPIGDKIPEVGQTLMALPAALPVAKADLPQQTEGAMVAPVEDSAVERDEPETESVQTKSGKPYTPELAGRLSVSSNLNFSDSPGGNSQRMRYTFSMDADHIDSSAWSFDTYISFVHRSGQWDEISQDIFNGLKIYNFSVGYAPSANQQLWLGRRINSNLSSVGAIDGLQYQAAFGNWLAGAFAGSRPDYTNYGFDPSLLQYGVWGAHRMRTAKGQMQTTLGLVQQSNSGATDRRFMYFQHTNSLLRKLYFFGSVEVNLYQKINGVSSGTFQLQNLYLMLRYRPVRQLSLSMSYSNRNNVIYYERYDQDFIERLLNTDATQGFLFRSNYRITKGVAAGINAGYRFRKDDPKPTKNVYGYVTFMQVPWIQSSLTLSATWLETSYLQGKIYSMGMDKELIRGRLNGGLNLRYVDYTMILSDVKLPQQVAEISFNYRLMKRLFASLSVEGTFEKDYNYQRVYLNLTQRF